MNIEAKIKYVNILGEKTKNLPNSNSILMKSNKDNTNTAENAASHLLL